MKTKNKSLIIAGVIVIIGIILIIAVVMLNQEKPIGENTNMTDNELIGKWNAVSIETLDGINNNLGIYSIVFNKDGSYTEIIENTKTNGLYKIEGDNITFYESGDMLDKPGSFNKGWFLIKDNQLTLTLPKYPKTVVYIKG